MAGRTAAPASGTTKKARKPYTITRPRERWAADEHHRFLHALTLFGRDWKRIEQFVGTKTSTQIRSHAQKHFLKAQKLGLSPPPPPPPHPRRAALLQQPMTTHSAVPDMAPLWLSPTVDAPTPAPFPGQNHQLDWASCYSPELPACCPNLDSTSDQAWLAADLEDETIRLPIGPDDLGFAQVYRFVGDVFGSGAAWPVEAHLRRLHGMDPAIAETILLVLRNLEANLSES